MSEAPKNYSKGTEMFSDLNLKAIATVGVPSVLLCYLVYWIATGVTGTLQTISTDLKAHQIDMSYSIKANEELKQQMYFNNLLLQQICANTAKNAVAAGVCFGKGEK